MLFSDQRLHKLSLPTMDSESKPVNVVFLVDYLCKNVMKDHRQELFLLDGHV
jgi:ubiquitin related modifier 1